MALSTSLRWFAPLAAGVGLLLSPVMTAAQSATIPLWPAGGQGGKADYPAEVVGKAAPFKGTIVRNVSRPVLEVFPADPAKANGMAVIVAPGGGFHMLSYENEGVEVARWLNSLGVTAFVLKYRLLATGGDFVPVFMARLMNMDAMVAATAPLKPDVTADGVQAVKLVRQRAAEWKVSPDRIGMMGFSAGGAVTAWATLKAEPASRPDFVAAIYPGLLGTLSVPGDAPPMFILAANDDPIGAPDSLKLYAAWRAAERPVELHLYEKGGHGFGMAPQNLPVDGWKALFEAWLARR
ncbi:alpha/beta hydrolase [Caulobacter sp. CCUG 60055]|nr:alpha/beta hydrolase [Caulobacter sp. CCUG 60055]